MIFKELFLGSYEGGVMRGSYSWGVIRRSYDKPLPLLPMDIWPLITPPYNSSS